MSTLRQNPSGSSSAIGGCSTTAVFPIQREWLQNQCHRGFKPTSICSIIWVSNYPKCKTVLIYFWGFPPEIFGSKCANHVLVNEYLPGQGIMPHFDGPLFYPTISTISCGSHTVLEFEENNIDNETDEEAASPSQRSKILKFNLLVERRSLLILKDDLYTRYRHSISEIESDIVNDDILNLPQCCGPPALGEKLTREKRISLTIRHVPKTSKMKLKFGF